MINFTKQIKFNELIWKGCKKYGQVKLFLCSSITLFFIGGNPQFIYSQNIGINTTGTTPNASALLDLDANPGNNLGLLIPRVALTATNSASPITSPATSLMVYNTATAGSSPNNVLPGYYYWNSLKWISLSGGTGGNDWSLLGNSGTTDGTNFIGTSDDKPLNIRVNNLKAGRIDNTLANTFFGYQAGNANTTGSNNTAYGYKALYSGTTRINNTAIGYKALYTNNNGDENIAIGGWALYTNTGDGNTASGYQALFANSTGYFNTAIGSYALNSNTSGNYNTAIGRAALNNNTSESKNIAIGNGALYTQSYNGSADADNVAIGYSALYNNNPSSGSNGIQNTAIGNYALNSNTTGFENTANGYSSLRSNTTGYYNTATGLQSLYTNTTGADNTAVGYKALFTNNGDYNTALGMFSLYTNNTGTDNVALGFNSLKLNSTGSNNTACGRSALYSTTGNSNSSLGYGAGTTNSSGSNNTFIGYNADANATNYSNTTAIGNGAIVTASNKVQIGNSTVSGLYFGTACNLSGSATAANMVYNTATGEIQYFTSSKRYKRDISNLEIPTSKIYDLRPVSFTSIYDNARHFGLIAEEVAEIIPELAEFAREKDVIKESDSEKMIPNAVQYPLLSVLLLAEVQKHQNIIQEQQKMIDILKEQNKELQEEQIHLLNEFEKVKTYLSLSTEK